MRRLTCFLFLFILGLVSASPAYAQRASVADLGPELNYTDISSKLKKIETSIKKGSVTSADLSADVDYLNNIRHQLDDSKKNIERDLRFVEKRIEALGEVPSDGSKEVDIIAQKRKEFNKELSNEKGRIAEVDILLTKIDELDLAIFNLRNRELLGNLLIRGTPLIYPAELYKETKEFVGFFFDIIKSPVDWYEGLNETERTQVKSKIIPVSLIILFVSWLGLYLRLFIMRRFGYRKEIEHPRYGKKVFAAIFVAVAYGVIPALIIASVLAWNLSSAVLVNSSLGMIINIFLYVMLVVVLARAASRVIFAPLRSNWRLVNLSDEKAASVTSAFYYSIALIGLTSFFVFVATKLNYPLELISYLTALSSAAKAFSIILITKRLMWDDEPDTPETTDLVPDGDAITDDNSGEDEEGEGDLSNGIRVTLLMSLFAIGTFILALVGYPYLSVFIFNRFIFSVILIGALFGLRRIFYEAVHRLLLLRFWVKTFRLRRKLIAKLDFWSSLIIDPLFILVGIFGLLALWGVPTDVLKNMIYKLFTGFTIGGVKISLISIILGFVAFFVTITIIKALRRRLENNVLSRMDIDEGIKHSLASGFGSIGYVVAALLAIAIMGGSLTNFALIAGALSFGVGLGLQNVVSNFVSGIILLFERPIKVGDWIVVNGEEGIVKQINIRSTELETWKRASIIIPNSDLLSSVVTNLTHDDKWGRVEVAVGVAYGSDVDKVRDILLEVSAANKRVLKKPAPYVIFKDFGASSLDFEVRAYIADVTSGLTIGSEIRFEINRRFSEEGIEIPFPQMVIHRGSEVAQETQSQFYALKRGKNASK